MLIKNNNETILNEYIDYLMDKGKIIKIKDTSKETNIKFSSGIFYYFLSIVSIALIILTIYLCGSLLISSDIDYVNNLIVVIGVALFTAIVIGVTLNKKKYLKLNITYPNENQIKVNKKIFDITKENCYLDITKNFEYHLPHEDLHGHYIGPSSYEIKYFLTIKGNKKSKSFQITNGTEEQLKDVIYNFEYEISDFKQKKSEFLKNAQIAREEFYDNGTISQDSLNKLYNNKNKLKK
jgi:hypothetical protein